MTTKERISAALRELNEALAQATREGLIIDVDCQSISYRTMSGELSPKMNTVTAKIINEEKL